MNEKNSKIELLCELGKIRRINADLLEALERALRGLETHIAIGYFYETEIIRDDLREAIHKAKE